MYSQGTKWGDHCTIYRWAETNLEPQRPSFLVHRLDRAANGLMILAHSKKMAKIFSDLFKNRAIQKRYKATVTGHLDELKLPYTIDSEIDNKPAVSRIISVEQLSETALISIEIETGRKHQVRKHLSEAGFPIVGDRLYGNASGHEQTNENLQLQSYYLKFECPVTNTIKEYSL
jgi:tRNA pseudouridine32 synthase/23S rRNA pseudouridine746 synthase